ncbi:CRISPR-associated helicase Cas3' [Azospirillum picis]|uniref:CRISPR-associated endonuclease/helicase Cas3 n=1 Tax=Azospirillum picis TaxID=488438 RepID=A0ABU0MTC7_9PROT|nr:CRISPR-associated helicase Cas3' [Azospirillum picis]MBP2301922.1 CRISPR-associated endonuclease/helicase Cas3 [Azospirillum picis]MDQ0536371.1 CRISPR-associated endonuclease/helicase Cas3 [Azospirillum picis]
MGGKRREPWGKSGELPGDFHHLAHHCADVAACFEAITALPTIRARLEAAAGAPLSARCLARLTALVFLHDIGKLHPGFQAKGWLPAERPALLRGHVAEGLALLMRLSSQGAGDAARVRLQLGLPDLDWWDDLHPFILASLSHHGRPLDAPAVATGWEAAAPSGTTYDPAEGARIIGTAMRSWFPDAFAGSPAADSPAAGLSADDDDNPPLAPRLQHLFAGLVALSDWLGSDRDFFDFEAAFRDDYIDTARARALKAVAAIRLDVEAMRRPAAGRTGFTALTGFAVPAAHQQATAEVPADRRLVILEAETGAGKTEAAVWRFARLFAAGAVDGLYFALPTRSAALQIHGRVNRLLERLTGPDGLKAVLAVPGYLKVGDAVGTALPHWRVRWDDEGERAEDELAARWAAENARRFLAAPVAVGTVDQAMLAALQVKHAHLRGACLSRSLLVVDEVHASDRYMGEILAKLLDIHLGAGGHALLMSATLGSRARTRWLGGTRAPDFAAAVAAPYPAVWAARGASKGAASASPAASPAASPTASADDPRARRKTVAMSLAPGWSAQEAADRALAAARSKAKVLVIRNTVTAAVATWEAVRAAGGDDVLLQLSSGPALHHGRFAAEDREALDDAVEKALSPGPERPDGGMIVIGTQTLEQSLDIDADHLVTDLCPVDVLLQRLGRLHRHAGVARPTGFAAPSCVVLAPGDGLEPLLAPRFENGLGAFQADSSLSGVYMDLSVLELTRRLVAGQAKWTIPDHNRLLVESALHEDRIEDLHAELGGGWSAYRDKLLGIIGAMAQAAHGVVVSAKAPFGEERFPGDDAAIRTRLGAEGARLTFPAPVNSPFGHPVSALTLPAHWSRGLDPAAPVTVERDGDALRVAVDGRRFRYDRRGVTKEGGK